MLAPPQRHKRPRPRSPSPPLEPDLASPLDILLKRRRRDEILPFSSPMADLSPFALSPGGGAEIEGDYFNLPDNHHHHQYHRSHEHEGMDGEGAELHPHAESSAAASRRSMAGIERRRARNWEKLNAPNAQLQPHHQSQSQSRTQHHSQPTPSPSHFFTPNVRSTHSQPAPMSSSPIRNMPPSSSPFRDKSNGAIDVSWMNDDEMEAEEMRKEWGEEYATQNSLLHSLHLARMQSQPHFPHQSQSSPFHNQQRVPHQQHQRTPQMTTATSSQTVHSASTLVSPTGNARTNTYGAANGGMDAHPGSYRQQPSYPDSSPFASHIFPNIQNSGNGNSPSIASPYGLTPGTSSGMADDEDMGMGMEILDSDDEGRGGGGGAEDEIMRRYEETNRLLGELEVVRRRRWGEGQ